MDLDLVLVRSFVTTAEELHFRHAADRLFITQQALSKRIQRLEDMVGVRLFDRTTRGVDLTAAGRDFLAPARDLLAAAAATTTKLVALRHRDMRPLRIDVVDERFSPLKLVHRLLAEEPGAPLQLTMHHALSTALPALVRGDLDAAFGRVNGIAEPWPSGALHRLIRLEPLAALVTKDHPYANRTTLRLADLRETGLWIPHHSHRSEWERYVRDLAKTFDIPLQLSGVVSSDDQVIVGLRRNQPSASIGGAEIAKTFSADIRPIPLADPAPVYPWSLVWGADDPHPLIPRLLEFAEETALDFIPGRHWVPDADRNLLPV